MCPGSFSIGSYRVLLDAALDGGVATRTGLPFAGVGGAGIVVVALWLTDAAQSLHARTRSTGVIGADIGLVLAGAPWPTIACVLNLLLFPITRQRARAIRNFSLGVAGDAHVVNDMPTFSGLPTEVIGAEIPIITLPVILANVTDIVTDACARVALLIGAADDRIVGTRAVRPVTVVNRARITVVALRVVDALDAPDLLLAGEPLGT